jgi:hypothetical protein
MARPLRFKHGVVQFMVRLPTEQRDALQAISAREGIPVAEQIRRAVEAWVSDHPGPRKPTRRSANARATAPRISLKPEHAIED